MSTGSVTPITPNGTTLNVTPSSAANSLVTVPQCDAVWVYNSGTVLVFVQTATLETPFSATPVITGGLPIPPGVGMLIGMPGVSGNNSYPSRQVAVLAAAIGTAGPIYITPVLGTQH